MVEWVGRHIQGEASLLDCTERGRGRSEIDRRSAFWCEAAPGRDFLSPRPTYQWVLVRHGNYVTCAEGRGDYRLRSHLAAWKPARSGWFVKTHRSICTGGPGHVHRTVRTAGMMRAAHGRRQRSSHAAGGYRESLSGRAAGSEPRRQGLPARAMPTQAIPLHAPCIISDLAQAG